MNVSKYRKIGYSVALFGFCVACLYGVVHAHYSTQSKCSNTYDWKVVAQKKNVIPIAVIGSGPAGWTASMYGARAGITAVVFEGDEPGGLLTTTGEVENYPGIPRVQGTDLMEYMRKQALDFGVRCVADTIEEVDFCTWPFVLRSSGGETFYALTVVIATGAAPRRLGIEGEDKYWGAGVSACARCDAAIPMYRNKSAIVIGGGDSAIEEALQLEPFSSEVTIVHRRGQLRAAPHVRQRIKNFKKINVLYDAQVKRIVGDGTEVTSVELELTDEKDGSTRTEIMPIDRVFLAIGHIPRTDIFKNVINTDDQGFIKCAPYSQETNIAGVFAAGDVADPHYRQAISAAGKGCMAGIDAINFLQEVGYSNRATELATNFYGGENTPAAEICSIANADEFEQFIFSPDSVSMVTFCESDQSYCKDVIDMLNTASKETRSQISFAVVNTAKNPGLAERYHVMKTPCMMFFDGGRLVARYGAGFDSVESLIKSIEQVSVSRTS